MSYFLLCWTAAVLCVYLLTSIHGQGQGTGFHPNMIGVASIDSAVPMFSKSILTLGSVALNNTQPQILTIIFPLKEFVLILPPEANQRRAVFFDAEDDQSDHISVEIAYLNGNWYHGHFATRRSTVNFIYQITNNTKQSVEAFKRLWRNAKIN